MNQRNARWQTRTAHSLLTPDAQQTKDYKKEITEEPKAVEKSPTAGRADKSDNTRSEYD